MLSTVVASFNRTIVQLIPPHHCWQKTSARLVSLPGHRHHRVDADMGTIHTRFQLVLPIKLLFRSHCTSLRLHLSITSPQLHASNPTPPRHPPLTALPHRARNLAISTCLHRSPLPTNLPASLTIRYTSGQVHLLKARWKWRSTNGSTRMERGRKHLRTLAF
jgi:hypothetical protein